jgi:hypothetical protein
VTLATLLIIITSEVFVDVSLAYAATSSVPSLPKFDPDFFLIHPSVSGINLGAGASQDNSKERQKRMDYYKILRDSAMTNRVTNLIACSTAIISRMHEVRVYPIENSLIALS